MTDKLCIEGHVYTRHDEGETPYWSDNHGFWAGGSFSEYLEREWSRSGVRVGFQPCGESLGTKSCRKPRGHHDSHAFI